MSISLLITYLTGSLPSSWTLIDFYLNRDDYTQKYCRFLDEGITQCRASCYLENLLEEQQSKEPDAKILSIEKYKITELTSQEILELQLISNPGENATPYLSNHYQIDFLYVVFHPPKMSFTDIS